MEKEVLLEVKDLDVTYGERKKKYKAVRQVNFKIYKGETFGLVGESGSGKTTIGRAIMRIVPSAGGEILYKGEKINGKISPELDRKILKEIQMIFQDPQASLNERAKVDYIISEGLMNIEKGISEQERKRRVEQAIADVGLLPEFSSRFPHEFSGGQRQRIGIARALVVKPSFIIADEPVSALDVSIQAQVINLLMDIKQEMDLTILFIAHNLAVVKYFSDRIGVMYFGNMVELADADELYAHPVHPYTKSLLSAIPQPDPVSEKNKQRIYYDPSIHHYDGEKPSFRQIRPGHFVYASDSEMERYEKELGQ